MWSPRHVSVTDRYEQLVLDAGRECLFETAKHNQRVYSVDTASVCCVAMMYIHTYTNQTLFSLLLITYSYQKRNAKVVRMLNEAPRHYHMWRPGTGPWQTNNTFYGTWRHVADYTSSHRGKHFFLHVLRAFAKLRKATISFVVSVCPHGITRLPIDRFSWNLIFEYFSKIFEKVQVSLKSDKNNRYFAWRPRYLYDSTSLNYS